MENTKMQGYLFESTELKSESDYIGFRNILVQILQKESYLDMYGYPDKIMGSMDAETYQRAIKNGLVITYDFEIEPIEMFFFKDMDDETSVFYKEFAKREKLFYKNGIGICPMMHSVKEFLKQEF